MKNLTDSELLYICDAKNGNFFNLFIESEDKIYVISKFQTYIKSYDLDNLRDIENYKINFISDLTLYTDRLILPQYSNLNFQSLIVKIKKLSPRDFLALLTHVYLFWNQRELISLACNLNILLKNKKENYRQFLLKSLD